MIRPNKVSPTGQNIYKSHGSFDLQESENGRICNEDAIITRVTRSEKLQIIKMLSLVVCPVLVLMGLTAFFLSSSGERLVDIAKQRSNFITSRRMAKLIHVLQYERDQSALYLSAIGPDTKTFLLKRYQTTNEAIVDIIEWTEDASKSRADFLKELKDHRNSIESSQNTIQEEINFYTNLLNIIIKGIYQSITKSRFGGMWKLMVAYQNIVTSKEDFGIQRALGSVYFSWGGFTRHEDYLWFMRKTHTQKFDYRFAQRLSPTVAPLEVYLQEAYGNSGLLSTLRAFNDIIFHQNITERKVSIAVTYYDNMSLVLDFLYDLQLSIVDNIKDKLDIKASESSRELVVGIIIMILVVLSMPFQIFMVIKQTTSIQKYSNALASKTDELDLERKKADSLLYTMLPKEIAHQLRNRHSVRGEYFSEVTVFFSEIHDFAGLTNIHTALQVVGVLEEMYSLFDSRIVSYDVYKVENIIDQNMIASGVPKRNGSAHATEIANMALDITNCFKTMDSHSIPGFRVNIRVGIHTGPVTAGVVGVTLPKYSLFGDTVNTAARMETNGKANMIHVSETTHHILKDYDEYKFTCRGELEIKGKGLMQTYWLEEISSTSSPYSATIETVPPLTSVETILKISDNDKGIPNQWSVTDQEVDGCKSMVDVVNMHIRSKQSALTAIKNGTQRDENETSPPDKMSNMVKELNDKSNKQMAQVITTQFKGEAVSKNCEIGSTEDISAGTSSSDCPQKDLCN